MRNTATEVKSEVAQRSLAGSVYVMFGKSVYQPTRLQCKFHESYCDEVYCNLVFIVVVLTLYTQ